MKKRKRKRPSLKKLTKEERMRNARKWLDRRRTRGLLDAYTARYKVSEVVAYYELFELGYGDFLRIEQFEQDGIEWEYMYDGYTDELKVVPKGTPEWELHDF
jgi:hypothetical protein